MERDRRPVATGMVRRRGVGRRKVVSTAFLSSGPETVTHKNDVGFRRGIIFLIFSVPPPRSYFFLLILGEKNRRPRTEKKCLYTQNVHLYIYNIISLQCSAHPSSSGQSFGFFFYPVDVIETDRELNRKNRLSVPNVKRHLQLPTTPSAIAKYILLQRTIVAK